MAQDKSAVLCPWLHDGLKHGRMVLLSLHAENKGHILTVRIDVSAVRRV